MTRLISGLYAFLFFCAAFAADVKDAPPPDAPNVVGIAIFFALFILMCVGFFGYMWWRHKNNKEE